MKSIVPCSNYGFLNLDLPVINNTVQNLKNAIPENVCTFLRESPN